MKKVIVLLSAILLISSFSIAQENMGARPIAMGGAFTGLADDSNAIFVNPGGIGYIRGEMASVSTKFSEGKEYTLIGGVESTPFGSVGVGYISASSALDELSDSTYEDLGDTPVRALNQTLVLSYARELNDFMIIPRSMGRLSLGSNIRFSTYRLNNAKGLAGVQDSKMDLDLGAVLKLNNSISYGISIKDLLSKSYEVDTAEENPSGPVLAAGISGKLDKYVTWSVEGTSYGCEFKPFSTIAFRVGRDGNYNTAGIGISIEGLGVDYAFLGKEEPVHYVAISLAIDRAPDLRQASIDIE